MKERNAMSSKLLRDWILDQPSITQLLPPWQKCDAKFEPLFFNWSRGSGSKAIAFALPQEAIPEYYTVIGGICSIYTAESEVIRLGQKRFRDIGEFVVWLRSWYPRLDQVHDTVGVPPKNTKRVIYVCEDSLFANRLSNQNGLGALGIEEALREVHKQQGHRVIVNWLRKNGYCGSVDVVYTSELSKEIAVALRIWQRNGNFKISDRDRDMAIVKLMYTHFWLDVLGIPKGVVYEPAFHMHLEERFSYLRSWFQNQKPKEIGFIGYLPFWSSCGQTRNLPLEQVPNFGNWREFQLEEGEEKWYTTNIFFAQKQVAKEGPTIFPPKEVRRRLSLDLSDYYGID